MDRHAVRVGEAAIRADDGCWKSEAQAWPHHCQSVSAGLRYLPACDAICAQDAHDGGDARIQEITELARWGARGWACFASATNDVHMQIYQAWCQNATRDVQDTHII